VGNSSSLMDQLMNNQISGGIVSSICFAAISGIYLLVLRRMRNAGLRALIPWSDSDVAVVCPGQPAPPGGAEAPSMTTDEAMALTEVLQCAAALKKHPWVLSSADKPRHAGIIALGGKVYNSFTAANLSAFCPGLSVEPPSGQDVGTVIRLGSTQIRPKEDESVAFIIRLSSSTTGCQGPALLIFGEYGSDTCAAACYLRKHANRLYHEFWGDSFAVKLVTRPRLGHQGFPDRHEDISAAVFRENRRSSKRRLLAWIYIPKRNRRPGSPPLSFPHPLPSTESRDRAA